MAAGTLAVLLVAAAASGAGPYTLAPIGVIDAGTPSSVPEALSNDGMIVGASLASGAAGPRMQPFFYDRGRLRQLPAPGASEGGALAVNDRGRAVGFFVDATARRAAIWDRGKLKAVIPRRGGGYASAFGVNRRGMVVGGLSRTSSDALTIHGFLWRPGRTIDLGTLGGTASTALDVNDDGVVVGLSQTAGDQITHAFRWAHGAMADIDPLGGAFSQATAINAAGDVVGNGQNAAAQGVAFLRRADGRVVMLDPLPGGNLLPKDVGDDRTVVGESSLGGASVLHAILWRDGTTADLNDLIPPDGGWLLVSARAINARGEIVCEALPPGETSRERAVAVLLTPQRDHPDDHPEAKDPKPKDPKAKGPKHEAKGPKGKGPKGKAKGKHRSAHVLRLG